MATNKNITMKQFNGVDYDILYPKTIASQIDDVYSKDEMSNLFLPKAGGSMGGILDMNGNRITNLPTPTSNSEPATKEYVDGKGTIELVYSGNTALDKSQKTITISKNFQDYKALLFCLSGIQVSISDLQGITIIAAVNGQNSCGECSLVMKSTDEYFYTSRPHSLTNPYGSQYGLTLNNQFNIYSGKTTTARVTILGMKDIF